MLPNTIEKAIGQPPVSSLVRTVGEDVLRLQVEYELTVLSALVSVGGNLNNFSIPFIARELIKDYPNESLADFKLCFQRGAMGAYGNIQRLDGVTIGVWFKEYLDEKYKVQENLLMAEKDKPYEFTPSKEAISIDDAKPYIDEILNNISKVEIRKVLPMKQSDIEREGQEKPVKSTYKPPSKDYVVLHRLQIEWSKQCLNPLTGKPNENFLSFEEWIKQ